MQQQTNPRLRRMQPNETPHHPSLHRDRRGIVVGAQALYLINGTATLSACIAALSHLVHLAPCVTVETLTISHATTNTPYSAYLVHVVPPTTTHAVSLFYDQLIDVLATIPHATSCATLFVGDGTLFVPYAPIGIDALHDGFSGYDALLHDTSTYQRIIIHPEYTLAVQHDNHLSSVVAHEHMPDAPDTPTATSWVLAHAHACILSDILIAIPLQRHHPTTRADTSQRLIIFTDRRLVPFVAHYANQHALTCRIAFIHNAQHNMALIELALHDESPIPAYIHAYLTGLARTTLFTDVLIHHVHATQRILVADGWRTRWYAYHAQGALPEKSMVLLTPEPAHNMLMPAPHWYALEELIVPMHHVAGCAVGNGQHTHAQSAPTTPLSFTLPLTLQHHQLHTASTLPVAGLLLTERDKEQLKRLLAYLPPLFFADVRIAVGTDYALLLGGTVEHALACVPYGTPLVWSHAEQLLIPRGMHISPAVPSNVLAAVLSLPSETITLLTPTHRYNIPRTALQPIAHHLAFTATYPQSAEQWQLTITPAPLPPLPFSFTTASPSAPHEQHQQHAMQGHGLWGKVRQSLGKAHTQQDAGASTRGSSSVAFDDELRKRAKQLEQTGAYDIAAAFYTYLRDDKRAATCYRRLLERTTEQ